MLKFYFKKFSKITKIQYQFKTRKDLIAKGDMVYFMFVNSDLYKIGKAGGQHGFAGRVGTYNRGRLGDATNNRIIDVYKRFINWWIIYIWVRTTVFLFYYFIICCHS